MCPIKKKVNKQKMKMKTTNKSVSIPDYLHMWMFYDYSFLIQESKILIQFFFNVFFKTS